MKEVFYGIAWVTVVLVSFVGLVLSAIKVFEFAGKSALCTQATIIHIGVCDAGGVCGVLYHTEDGLQRGKTRYPVEGAMSCVFKVE